MSWRSSEAVTIDQRAGDNAHIVWCSVGVILLLSIVVILIPNVPPLQDFNEWAYQGFLIKERVFGEPIPAAVKHWPVPYAFSQLTFALLPWLHRAFVSASTASTPRPWPRSLQLSVSTTAGVHST